MLRRLYHLLRESEARGETLSLAALAEALHTTPETVRQLLEILAWEGRLQRIDSAGCGLEGQGCSTCPLNKVCVRGVTHEQHGYVLSGVQPKSD